MHKHSVLLGDTFKTSYSTDFPPPPLVPPPIPPPPPPSRSPYAVARRPSPRPYSDVVRTARNAIDQVHRKWDGMEKIKEKGIEKRVDKMRIE